MPVRSSEATWEGTLKDGSGNMSLGSGAYEGAYTFVSRFEDGEGSNPEELIGAAHAGCFAMAFANELDKAGFPADRVHATANVHLEDGDISLIELVAEADVPDVSETEFQEIAEGAKENCTVSRLLAGGTAEITLNATLS